MGNIKGDKPLEDITINKISIKKNKSRFSWFYLKFIYPNILFKSVVSAWAIFVFLNFLFS